MPLVLLGGAVGAIIATARGNVGLAAILGAVAAFALIVAVVWTAVP